MQQARPQAGMSEPATYEIRVGGCISERWTDWLAGLAITHEDVDPAGSTTRLVGELTDQAALLGLLQALYTLGLPLLEVKRARSAAPSAHPGQTSKAAT